MKRLLAMSLATVLSVTWISCGAKSGGKVDLSSFENKVSYMIGKDIGKSLKNLETKIDMNALSAGITEVLQDSKTPLMSDSALMAVSMEFSKIMQAKQMEMQTKKKAEMDSVGVKNKAAGDAFLAANKAKTGVIATASGLQYEVVKEGTGSKPGAGDNVTVHYKGTLIDGTEFDNSYKRNEPATFPVSGVIKGWGEGLQLMKVGGKYKLYVPSDLGYGPNGAGDKIGPNAVLVFEVELIGIVKPAVAPAAAAPAAKPAAAKPAK